MPFLSNIPLLDPGSWLGLGPIHGRKASRSARTRSSRPCRTSGPIATSPRPAPPAASAPRPPPPRPAPPASAPGAPSPRPAPPPAAATRASPPRPAPPPATATRASPPRPTTPPSAAPALRRRSMARSEVDLSPAAAATVRRKGLLVKGLGS
uniref:Uncharacterized protein n=1 Tax=Arundo donax TaxID=35708 RepID=A0A0A9BNY7_ARUDO